MKGLHEATRKVKLNMQLLGEADARFWNVKELENTIVPISCSAPPGEPQGSSWLRFYQPVPDHEFMTLFAACSGAIEAILHLRPVQNQGLLS